MLGTLYKYLPTSGKIAVSVTMLVIFCFFWLFVGNYSSTYYGCSAKADEAQKRKKLPADFIPIPMSSTMTGRKEIKTDNLFKGKWDIIEAYFHTGLLESSVQEFYDKKLPETNWKVVKREKTKESSVIKLEKNELKGEIEIIHQSAGSDFVLSVARKR